MAKTQVDRIVDFLFEFQPPPDMAMPTIPPDLFKVDPDRIKDRNWAGLLRGEALAGLHPDPKVGVWNEIAHIDMYVGRSQGPAGTGFAVALATQGHGFNNLFAVCNPNLATTPSYAMVTKVATDTLDRANQMFGPCQSAVSDAVMFALENGFYPDAIADDLVGVVGVFVHPYAGAAFDGAKPKKQEGKLVMLTGDEAAASNHRLYCLNYVSMIAAQYMAVTGGRPPKELIAARAAIPDGHILRGFKPKKAA